MNSDTQNATYNGQPSDSTAQNQHFHGTHQIDPSDVVLYFLAFFFPPLSVYLRTGLCTKDFLLNILLTSMFGVPGTIHAIYIVYITSPVTGTSERRINRQQFDYERIVENNGPRQGNSYAPEDQHLQQQNMGSSSDHFAQPPPYEEATSGVIKNPTDNKVQGI
ncbi:hypothetical protein WICPIJ_003096 [Wickerhamomyces pijperi]|uniref:Uncharacterized protein n=1 Tax=Wickerhamomyces pijperi TaxID=599730 RepID=A0A9P8Q7P2_WICPI|nr:hypothetical protein WICPIJ_003096 [Wickerhamomyces pijperi]